MGSLNRLRPRGAFRFLTFLPFLPRVAGEFIYGALSSCTGGSGVSAGELVGTDGSGSGDGGVGSTGGLAVEVVGSGFVAPPAPPVPVERDGSAEADAEGLPADPAGTRTDVADGVAPPGASDSSAAAGPEALGPGSGVAPDGPAGGVVGRGGLLGLLRLRLLLGPGQGQPGSAGVPAEDGEDQRHGVGDADRSQDPAEASVGLAAAAALVDEDGAVGAVRRAGFAGQFGELTAQPVELDRRVVGLMRVPGSLAFAPIVHKCSPSPTQ